MLGRTFLGDIKLSYEASNHLMAFVMYNYEQLRGAFTRTYAMGVVQSVISHCQPQCQAPKRKKKISQIRIQFQLQLMLHEHNGISSSGLSHHRSYG